MSRCNLDASSLYPRMFNDVKKKTRWQVVDKIMTGSGAHGYVTPRDLGLGQSAKCMLTHSRIDADKHNLIALLFSHHYTN